MFIIETIERVGHGEQWVDLPGGEYNEFETEEEAWSMIPELVRNIGDCVESDFRVVERAENC